MNKVINQTSGKNWNFYHADCVEVAKEIPDSSIHYSIYSPPFESLYSYSNSERDMGNSKSSDEFWQHYRYLIAETMRVMMHGRLVSVHCMNLPTSKTRDGYIGLRDFRGEIIRSFVAAGFIYHSEVCIWKDPVVAMQRTKALGLLHKQIKKDSCMSRQGIADYLVTFRKPDENPERVEGLIARYKGNDEAMKKRSLTIDDANEVEKTRFSIDVWQRYASPVWMDIDAGNTLQKESARDNKDERHICPLQLQVIERGIQLWSNPGDIVWSPFGGIASEGYVALGMGRKFIGTELKDSYFKQGSLNLQRAENEASSLLLL
jgi:DNA modification methylase